MILYRLDAPLCINCNFHKGIGPPKNTFLLDMFTKAFIPLPLGLNGHNEQNFCYCPSCTQILFFLHKIPSIFLPFKKKLTFS